MICFCVKSEAFIAKNQLLKSISCLWDVSAKCLQDRQSSPVAWAKPFYKKFVSSSAASTRSPDTCRWAATAQMPLTENVLNGSSSYSLTVLIHFSLHWTALLFWCATSGRRVQSAQTSMRHFGPSIYRVKLEKNNNLISPLLLLPLLSWRLPAVRCCESCTVCNYTV